MEIRATTSVTHAHLSSVMWNSAGGGGADGLHITDFSAQTEELTDDNGWGETSFTYVRAGGATVNGQLAFDEANTIGTSIFGGTRQCLISGFVMSSSAS